MRCAQLTSATLRSRRSASRAFLDSPSLVDRYLANTILYLFNAATCGVWGGDSDGRTRCQIGSSVLMRSVRRTTQASEQQIGGPG